TRPLNFEETKIAVAFFHVPRQAIRKQRNFERSQLPDQPFKRLAKQPGLEAQKTRMPALERKNPRAEGALGFRQSVGVHHRYEHDATVAPGGLPANCPALAAHQLLRPVPRRPGTCSSDFFTRSKVSFRHHWSIQFPWRSCFVDAPAAKSKRSR